MTYIIKLEIVDNIRQDIYLIFTIISYKGRENIMNNKAKNYILGGVVLLLVILNVLCEKKNIH